MRGLIASLDRTVQQLRERAAEQHIADLELSIQHLSTARRAIDLEIDQTAQRLLQAYAVRDALSRGRTAERLAHDQTRSPA